MSEPPVNPYNTLRLIKRHDHVQGEPLIESTATNLAVAAIIIVLAVWIARRVIFKSELKELHERHRNR